MAAYVNKVILVGNLGRDPEVKYSAEGMAVCNLSLATTRKWKDKNSGERKEETEWHRAVGYGRTAETLGEYGRKGASLYVEGRLKTRKWTDKDGIERYTTEIVIEQFQFNGGRDDEGSRDGNNGGGGQRQQQRPAQQPSGGGGSDMDDDIPFAPYGGRGSQAYAF